MVKRKRSFRYYLMKSYLFIAIFPISIMLIIIFINTLKSTQITRQAKMNAAVELISSQVNSLVENMSFISINLISSVDVISAAKGLGYKNNTIMKTQEYYSTLKKEFCSFAIVDSPYDVIFFTNDGYYITSDKYNIDYSHLFRLDQSELENLNWLNKVEHNYGQGIILPVQSNVMPRLKRESLSLVRAVRDPGKNVGYLGVLVNKEYLDSIFSISNQVNGEVLMLGENNEVIYATEGFPVDLYKKGFNRKDNKKISEDYLSTFIENKDNQIVIVMTCEKRSVIQEAIDEVILFALGAAFLLVLTVFFIFWYANKLTRPLKGLTVQMQKITIDDLNDNSLNKASNYEEIDYLYNGYAQMRHRLNTMLQNEITSKTLQMQEKLNFLQSQINPHFLYNTLNVIGIMGMEGGNKNIYNACFKLSSILRYSIADKNGNTSTLREEIENTREYLDLMKLRFEHRLNYTIICDQILDSIRVPRLILQPFAENVIEHAYNAEHTSVLLSFRGMVELNTWKLIIEDDGKGMDDEDIEHLNQEIHFCINHIKIRKERIGSRGIGIQNTILRLVLALGENFSYSIGKGEKGGMKIIISSKLNC